MYIALEGVDTCGKSTQIAALKEMFPDALFVKEPGFTELGKGLREMLLHGSIESKRAELFLFLADRAELSHKVIKPNIKQLIISDRSLVSGIGYASEFDLEFLVGLNYFALDGCLPNGVLMLELSEVELENRLSKKSQDRIEKSGIKHLMYVQERMKMAINVLGLKALFLDASDTVENITSQISEFINRLSGRV